MVKRSRILGCGSYLPANVVTNRDLESRVDTTDEWIVQRTGIKARHIAAEGELTSDLAVAAATRALEHAGVDAGSIDCIVLATTTPDNTFPATATKVQAALGTKGFALDIQAVCAGFVYALSIADNFIRAGQATRALVIGAETFSRLLDWKDRTTCVLFGDGAGAVVLEGYDAPGTSADRGVLSTHLHSDGSTYGLLYVDGGPSTTGTTGHVRMNGQDVFRHAVSKLSSVVEEALAANGMEPSTVDWLVPHQANQRIIDGIARKLKLSTDKVVLTVDRHGNTSAASIPLALAEAVHDGRIKRGDVVLMEAIGGGLSWGAALVRW
ncbi:beta-ketoacyl-ACP synthase III [Azospirillum rugosum]|uniref:Beta-ketoacyl-[acyl-carrier-protein] synthase III n=1 Tax=Azospirillum rugosum TaxID=416170 RepID=A0ABS4SPX8_9PROT|nr:beta-ketoacyl-ACP synthase III [Azospirillum rugosum]MBP2294611.1 3-oxoacyl-[acyl-carrier-protein] synthase-3 [Azospirillum rugosum]MDQ0528100.1 3-oxoacyl-[acyl-carrier-protein] synthase-3 [Azospirillum rugosum]